MAKQTSWNPGLNTYDVGGQTYDWSTLYGSGQRPSGLSDEDYFRMRFYRDSSFPTVTPWIREAERIDIADQFGAGLLGDLDERYQNLAGQLNQSMVGRGLGNTTRYDKDRVLQSSSYMRDRGSLLDMIARTRMQAREGSTPAMMLADKRGKEGASAGQDASMWQGIGQIGGGLLGSFAGPIGSALGSWLGGNLMPSSSGPGSNPVGTYSNEQGQYPGSSVSAPGKKQRYNYLKKRA